MSDISHISFATANFSQSAKILRRSARRFGITNSYVFTPQDDVIKALATAYPGIMGQARGAGYWLWKPFIIEETLNKLPDGAIVLYTDCAVTFTADPKALFDLAEQHELVFFSQNWMQKFWTKRDCFIELDADSEEYWNLDQLTATFQLYKNGDRARRFIAELKTAMLNERALTDLANQHGQPDLEGYRAHRHDQSILTILAHRAGAAIFPDPSQYGPFVAGVNEELPYRQTFHHHRLRNTTLVRHLKWRWRRTYTGGAYFV